MHRRRLFAVLRAGSVRRPAGANVLGGRLHQEKVDERLVQGDELVHPVAEGTDDCRGVGPEPLHRLAIAPGALLLQRLRQIPVEEGDHRLDTGSDEVIDEPAVIGEARLVHPAGALRQNACPGQREAVGVGTELAHQRDVAEILVAVIGVAGDVAGLLLAGRRHGDAVAVGVDVPIRQALAIGLPTALDLIGGACRPPDKPARHGRRHRRSSLLTLSNADRFPSALFTQAQTRVANSEAANSE